MERADLRRQKLSVVEGPGWHPSQTSRSVPELRVIEGEGRQVDPAEALTTVELIDEVGRTIEAGRYFDYRDPDWRERRHCSSVETDWFYQEDSESKQWVKAELCTPCGVRMPCLIGAIESGEPYDNVCGCADLQQRRQIAESIRETGRDVPEF